MSCSLFFHVVLPCAIKSALLLSGSIDDRLCQIGCWIQPERQSQQICHDADMPLEDVSMHMHAERVIDQMTDVFHAHNEPDDSCLSLTGGLQ